MEAPSPKYLLVAQEAAQAAAQEAVGDEESSLRRARICSTAVTVATRDPVSMPTTSLRPLT